MSRNKRDVNAIVEAAEREDIEEGIDLGEEAEFGALDVEEYTDEDVEDMVMEMPADKQALINKSRLKSQSTSADPRRHTAPAAVERDHVDPDEVESFRWRPSNSLEAPPALPGMEQRWIRASVGSDMDGQNWAKAIRGHWAPRPIDTVPGGYAPPTMKHGTLGTVIAAGDVILCHRDRRWGVSRRKFFRKLQERQVAASRRYYEKVQREDHPISVYDPDLKPTVGRGRRVRAQEDEG